MRMNKKLMVFLFLASTVLLGIAGSNPPQDQPKRNLKVLPKNITHDELEAVMNNFKAALGVKCNHCHSPRKDDDKKLDFASDEKPEKEMARKMMRMTSRINKKFFHYKKEGEQEIVPIVSCKTCHNGMPRPEK